MMHVLKDEKLGVDREYVAVDRNAEVGEKIYTLVDGGDFYRKGEYGVVYSLDGNCAHSRFESNSWLINHKKYHVLEPTDIVHIDGERYRLEDPEKDAIKFTMEIGGNLVNIEPWDATRGPIISGGGETYKLTPVTDDREEEEPKESDVITVLANLGAEVAELKRTVAGQQSEINALHDNKVRLGEQLAKVVAAGDPKALSVTADEIAQIFVSLKKAGL
ncbi:hypothetical protein [Bacillus stratosphericus]|uniref:hypothetical protein n=1 Tax=Bacillus stratosphericus TaxID=293386 RepID=UPI001CFB3F4C|nr:hypothetical protein [Bacillus stratosphericus]